MTDAQPAPPTVDENEELRAFAAQLVELEDGAVIARGSIQVKVAGSGALEAVESLYRLVIAGGQTRKSLVESFPEPDRELVENLVEHLIHRRLFAPRGAPTPELNGDTSEDALDVFFWNFGLDCSRADADLGSRSIVIFGVNTVSRQLSTALRRMGVEDLTVVDHPMLRNLREFPDDGSDGAGWDEELPVAVPMEAGSRSLEARLSGCDALVACADFAAVHVMRDLNQVAVAANRPFLPVALARMVGRLGPFVVPGQTPCYECLVGRENSHLRDFESRRRVDTAGLEGQFTDGAHPSMGSILGDLAAMELTKYFVSPHLQPRVGRLITVYLLAPNLDSRRVLRLPRCPVCSQFESTSPTSLIRYDFVPGNQFEPGAGNEAARERLLASRQRSTS